MLSKIENEKDQNVKQLFSLFTILLSPAIERKNKTLIKVMYSILKYVLY